MTLGYVSEIFSSFQGEGVFADMLGHIAFYCKQNGLPSLTDLVVKKNTGLPGDGLATQVADFNAERERVYAHGSYSPGFNPGRSTISIFTPAGPAT